LPCPQCGEKTEKTIGWLKDDPDTFVCAGCGRTVNVGDIDDLGRIIQSIDDAWDDLGDTFDDLNEG